MFREKFSVEEFRAATFEVGLKAARPTARARASGSRSTSRRSTCSARRSPARRSSGACASATTALRVRRLRAATRSRRTARVVVAWYDRDDDYGEFVADGDGTTNAQGQLAIAARDGATKFDGPGRLHPVGERHRLGAIRRWASRVVVTAHKTSLYLGLHANEFVQAVGMPFGVNLVALDARRQAGRREGEAVVHRARCTRARGATSGARSYQSCTSTEKPMLERDVDDRGRRLAHRAHLPERARRLRRPDRDEGRPRQRRGRREPDVGDRQGRGVLERRRGRPDDAGREQAELPASATPRGSSRRRTSSSRPR